MGLSTGVELRVIDPEWSCQQSGDCCRIPPFVTMTPEERELLEEQARIRAFNGNPVQLTWVPHEDPRFVMLKAAPCPFVGTTLDGRSSCTVYSARPYNCRRFGCQRPNPKEELWETDAKGGCSNLLDRIQQSRVARRLATLMQRKAQKWALKHGWVNDSRTDRS